jgi:hypothetical protein
MNGWRPQRHNGCHQDIPRSVDILVGSCGSYGEPQARTRLVFGGAHGQENMGGEGRATGAGRAHTGRQTFEIKARDEGLSRETGQE